MSPILFALVVAVAGNAGQVGPAARVSTGAASEQSSAASETGIRHLGLGLDAGVPNGVGLSLVGRPWHFLRLHGGVAHNVLSTGIRGGLSLVPFKFYVTPALTFEAGQFFGRGGLVDQLGIDSQVSELAKRLTYRYVNLHLGLEFGSPRTFTFYLHGGLSRVWGTVRDLNGLLSDSLGAQGLTVGDARVVMTVPSAALGFYFYFL